jgi:hypothetical protein
MQEIINTPKSAARNIICKPIPVTERSKARPATTRLLGLQVRIAPMAWMFVLCGRCVLPGRGYCAWLITRQDGSYREWCV